MILIDEFRNSPGFCSHSRNTATFSGDQVTIRGNTVVSEATGHVGFPMQGRQGRRGPLDITENSGVQHRKV